MLATKTKNHDSIALTNVELEVNETNCEHKRISLVKNFSEETIIVLIGSDTLHKESAF